MSETAASLPTMLGRALLLRCPRCGGSRIFRRFWTLAIDCPTCGHRFEREQGYWVGSMIIVTGFVIVTFLLILVGGIALTWPDVPWTGLLVSTATLNGLIVVFGYPWAQTVWMAIEMKLRPLEVHETTAAEERITNRSSREK